MTDLSVKAKGMVTYLSTKLIGTDWNRASIETLYDKTIKDYPHPIEGKNLIVDRVVLDLVENYLKTLEI